MYLYEISLVGGRVLQLSLPLQRPKAPLVITPIFGPLERNRSANLFAQDQVTITLIRSFLKKYHENICQ